MLALASASVSAQGELTTRVSVGTGGIEGNGFAHTRTAISSDGGAVVFCGDADNLVPGDTNGVGDIFLFERATARTFRLSVDSAGAQANGLSFFPSVSADGRVVAFQSSASNLVAADTNGCEDVFVHDRLTATTVRVSVDSAGLAGDGASSWPALSADGRYVAFFSSATNLVGGDTNLSTDVFVHDRVTGNTTRVSVGPGGAQANAGSARPSMSADGRFVAFHSSASNLVPGDANGVADVFVVERATLGLERVSVGPGGLEASGASNTATISADGAVVAFESLASNLVPGDGNGCMDAFVRDRPAGTTARASVSSLGGEGSLPSFKPALSGDGGRVAFYGESPEFVPGDANALADAFLFERASGLTRRLSVDPLGGEADGASSLPAVSTDGRFVVFASFATNLVAGDANGENDVFLRDLAPATVVIRCAAKTNSLGCVPAMSALGAASASAASGFVLSAADVRNQKVGMLLYGLDGPAAVPFQGGLLCVASPIRRVPGSSSGGSASGNDCTGVLAVDWNAFARGALGGNPHPTLSTPGTVVEAQWWGRDPGFAPPNNTTLSDGAQFTVGV